MPIYEHSKKRCAVLILYFGSFWPGRPESSVHTDGCANKSIDHYGDKTAQLRRSESERKKKARVHHPGFLQVSCSRIYSKDKNYFMNTSLINLSTPSEPMPVTSPALAIRSCKADNLPAFKSFWNSVIVEPGRFLANAS